MQQVQPTSNFQFSTLLGRFKKFQIKSWMIFAVSAWMEDPLLNWNVIMSIIASAFCCVWLRSWSALCAAQSKWKRRRFTVKTAWITFMRSISKIILGIWLHRHRSVRIVNNLMRRSLKEQLKSDFSISLSYTPMITHCINIRNDLRYVKS